MEAHSEAFCPGEAREGSHAEYPGQMPPATRLAARRPSECDVAPVFSSICERSDAEVISQLVARLPPETEGVCRLQSTRTDATRDPGQFSLNGPSAFDEVHQQSQSTDYWPQESGHLSALRVTPLTETPEDWQQSAPYAPFRSNWRQDSDALIQRQLERQLQRQLQRQVQRAAPQPHPGLCPKPAQVWGPAQQQQQFGPQASPASRQWQATMRGQEDCYFADGHVLRPNQRLWEFEPRVPVQDHPRPPRALDVPGPPQLGRKLPGSDGDWAWGVPAGQRNLQDSSALQPAQTGSPYKNHSTEGASSASIAPPSSGGSALTTVMLRNVPVMYTQEMLVDELLTPGTYDFVYLPRSGSGNSNLGYAFVNFISGLHAAEFKFSHHRSKLKTIKSNKPLNISYADVQGLFQNLVILSKKKGARGVEVRNCEPIVIRDGINLTMQEALEWLAASDGAAST